MEQNHKGKIYRRLTAGFFLFMLLCTVISRIYDSVTVPKAVTAYVQRKPVMSETRGTGTIRENQTESAGVMAGVRIGSVPVIPGSKVSTGDVLFAYQVDSLLDKKEECGRELEKLKLDLEKQEISAQVYAGASQSELSAFEVQMAERELAEGEQDYGQAKAEYDAALEKLKQDYERKSVLTEDELWEQQNEQYEAARRALAQSRRTRDAEVREAERKVEALEKQLEELEGGSDEEKAEQLERELDRAREDLDTLIDSWDNQVEDAEYELEMIDGRRGRIESGQTSAQEALKESYDAAVKDQERVLEGAAEKVDTFKKAAERARFEAGTAAKSDEAARLTNEQKEKLAELTKKGLQMDIEKKLREAAKLDRLIAEEGCVKAWADGTVAVQELIAGKTTTGEEILSVAIGGLLFEGSFEKDSQTLSVGDILDIAIPGTSRKMESKVVRINLLGETGIFQADVEEVFAELGAVTDYECKKQSDSFNQVIPIGALRKDMMGYYCLVARPKSGILGEEFVAGRVDVQLLYEGSIEVAIEGALYEEDQIIEKSSQIIQEGDRIRVVPEL